MTRGSIHWRCDVVMKSLQRAGNELCGLERVKNHCWFSTLSLCFIAEFSSFQFGNRLLRKCISTSTRVPCLGIDLLLQCMLIRMWKRSKKSPLSPKEQTDMHPFIKNCFIFNISDLLGPRGSSVSLSCLSGSQRVGLSPFTWQWKGNRESWLAHATSPTWLFFSNKCPMENGIYIMYWGFQFQNLLENLTTHKMNHL